MFAADDFCVRGFHQMPLQYLSHSCFYFLVLVSNYYVLELSGIDSCFDSLLGAFDCAIAPSN